MTTLSLADARAQFSKLIEAAATTHERFEVTRNGRRVAVVLAADDYDALLETVEVLGDAAAVQAIGEGLRDIGAGELAGVDEVRAAMRDAGRLQA
jgi:antitoxin YefM